MTYMCTMDKTVGLKLIVLSYLNFYRFVLEQTFKDYKFLAYSEREELAAGLGLSENQVHFRERVTIDSIYTL